MQIMICRATPYEGKEPYIFVSYCHKDCAHIYPLIEQMSLDGYRVWYDVGNSPGANWLRNIEDHLEKCTAVIAFISKHSSDSNNCNREIIYAMKCEKKVIPVLIETVALPRGLRMQMVDLHYLEQKDFPSDKELLKKCYEVEECGKCKDPSGRIPLRNGTPVRPKDDSGKGFWGGLIPFSSRPPVTKSGPKTKPDPQPEPDPAPVSHQSTSTCEDSPVSRDCDEQTHSPSFGLCSDVTVVGYGLDDNTVRGTLRVDIDEDRTVLISRNLAILLRLAERSAFMLNSPRITIGRSRIHCDVAIEGNETISKVHAIISQTRQQCFIEDANSSNGTYINGNMIKPGEKVPLENPAIFQLNDESLVLLSGSIAKNFDMLGSISLLVNDKETAVRIMDSDTLSLNRSNTWPDGTLSDPKVHRAGHALLRRREDGVHLIDESPENGNGTYLNGSRMRHGGEARLSSGDRIRLGDTTLEFITIDIPS